MIHPRGTMKTINVSFVKENSKLLSIKSLEFFHMKTLVFVQRRANT